jgi:cytochrome bd-type quinol oxidase subunit 2
VSHHGIRPSTPVSKGFDPGYLWGRLDRVWPSVRSLVEKSFATDWLAILPLVLVVVSLVLLWRRSHAALFAAGALAIVFLSLLWAYWVQRPGLHYLLSTSGDRTVTTLVVVAGVFLPIVGAELVRSRKTPPP